MTQQHLVHVVDDDPGALNSMRWLLESEGLAVETYPTGRQFLDSQQPDCASCLVLDLNMSDMDGLELQEELFSRDVRLPIIFVSGHGDVPKCVQAMRAGAIDFLEKPANDERLLSLVRHALHRDANRRRVEANQLEVTERIARLTPRERETLTLLRDGKEIKSIAAKFGVSIQTAAKHRSRTLEKLDVRNEAELVLMLSNYTLDEQSDIPQVHFGRAKDSHLDIHSEPPNT